MQSNLAPKPIYEFLLWENCNNHCKFCFQKSKRQLKVAEREKALAAVLRFLDSDQYEKGSHVLAVGGELFYSGVLTEPLRQFYLTLFQKMLVGDIDLLYINTNLLYRDLSPLLVCLEEAAHLNLLPRIRFTSSYDRAGRFRTDNDRLRMELNLDVIRERYPELAVVVNMMLTKPFCEQEIFSHRTIRFETVAEFCHDHQCEVNLIPYIIKKTEFIPSKEEVIKTLLYVEKDMPGYLKRYLANWRLAQEKRLYQYDKDIDDFHFVSSETADCGHSENFKRCFADGECFICFIEKMLGDYVDAS